MRTLIALCILFSAALKAQTNDQASTYHSDADKLVVIDRVGLVSFIDNLGGIYSRPLEAHFAKILGEMHRWSFVGTAGLGDSSIEELEEDSNKVKAIGEGQKADALFAGKIIKGPKGITIRLDFFLVRDGLLFLQAEEKELQHFELPQLKEKLESLFTQIVRKIPYSGRILSRDGTRVTLNLGSRDGLEKDRVLTIIQIIDINRHPKFNFLINSEKETIAKVKVLKVDDTLSFGTLVFEKQRGAVAKGSKIDSLEMVSYSGMDMSLKNEGNSITDRPDAKVAFGDNAKAWKPYSEPTLGQVGARLGISRFNQAMNLSTGTNLSATDNLGIVGALDGEMWITSTWTAHAQIRQGIFAVSGPGGNVSESLSAYELLGGYKFRFGPSIWSPWVEPFFGYMTYLITGDGAYFTSMQYSGFKLGVQGMTPITDDNVWSAGVSLAFVFSPSLNEAPGSSGSSSTNVINQFSLIGSRRMTEHWRIQGNLDYEIYTTNFSGSGSRPNSALTAAQRYMNLTAGAYYSF